MRIVADQLSREDLGRMAAGTFGDMVKAAVDVKREIIAVDAELHADLESLLLAGGSMREDQRGINLYPDGPAEDFVEFDSMINVRPSRGNRSRGVDDPETRKRITDVMGRRIGP